MTLPDNHEPQPAATSAEARAIEDVLNASEKLSLILQDRGHSALADSVDDAQAQLRDYHRANFAVEDED